MQRHDRTVHRATFMHRADFVQREIGLAGGVIWNKNCVHGSSGRFAPHGKGGHPLLPLRLGQSGPFERPSSASPVIFATCSPSRPPRGLFSFFAVFEIPSTILKYLFTSFSFSVVVVFAVVPRCILPTQGTTESTKKLSRNSPAVIIAGEK
ncbi:hypothetical protein BDV59DRAFT_61485 [Aspergillus ambiguus]|uniref:uncharacterized protein n=1 Tax=Aspergillus ambiguus TaxID=176160 RepID=UPI003CCDA66F